MKQKLSAQARRDKAARDLAFAKSPARRAKKAHSQREARANPSAAAGKDFDHKRGRFVSVRSNRGNEGEGTKKEGKVSRLQSLAKAMAKIADPQGRISDQDILRAKKMLSGMMKGGKVKKMMAGGGKTKGGKAGGKMSLAQ